MAEHEHVDSHSVGYTPQLPKSHERGHDHVHGPGGPGGGHDHPHTHQDEEAAPEKGEQTVTVEDVGPARKCLTIEIPAERIAKKLESGYNKLRDDATLPGFRRGRAPKRLIEKRFGDSIRDDVRTQLLSECYQQAIEEQKLEVIGEPDVKDIDKIKLPDSGTLTFKVEVEVAPIFELPDFGGIEVKRPKAVVADADIDQEIERLRMRFGHMGAAAEGVAREDDYLQCDVRVLKGHDADPNVNPDTPVESDLAHHPETHVIVPGAKTEFRGHAAGFVIDDLGKLLPGKKIGESVTIKLTGPAGHEDEKIRNQAITLVMHVDKIERLEALAVEALPARLGLPSLEELRKELRRILDERAKIEQKNALHRQVCDYLLEKVAMDLPAGLSGRQTARLLQRQAMELAYRGVPESEIEGQIAELRTTSEERARKELKLFFILEKAARKLEVEVTEPEVNGTIYTLATQQGRRPEKLRQQMQRSGQLEQVYLQVRENKTLDKILAGVKVVDEA